MLTFPACWKPIVEIIILIEGNRVKDNMVKLLFARIHDGRGS